MLQEITGGTSLGGVVGMVCGGKYIAQYIVAYFVYKEAPVNNLRLQKLLYFLWIDYYKKTKRSLFNELFLAWPLGPVLGEAYYDFCVYGSGPIHRAPQPPQGRKADIKRVLKINHILSDIFAARTEEVQPGAASDSKTSAWAKYLSLCEVNVKIVDDILEEYAPLDTDTLITKSHHDGGAWRRVYGENGEGRGKVISFEEIKRWECGD